MLASAIKKRLVKEEGQKGFTLIELLAVIVILGIIAVIAIPLIGNIISNAKEDSDVATARQVYDAARLYIAGEKDGKFNDTTNPVRVTVAEMKSKGYLDNGVSLPSTKAAVTGGEVVFTTTGQLDYVTLSPKPLGSTKDDDVLVSGSTKLAGGRFSAQQVLKSSTSTAAPAVNP